MAGGKTDQQLLLVGATDGDTETLRRALGGGWAVRRARSHEAPEDVVRLPNLEAVILAKPDAVQLGRWRIALSTAGSSASLLALADDATEPELANWLVAGADDVALRTQAGLLPVTFARLARDRARMEQGSRAEQVRAATVELLQLAQSPNFRSTELEPAMREVTTAAVRAMVVDRCSLWRFDESRSALFLADRCDAKTQVHTQGERFLAQEYRATLAALLGQRLVAASEVALDPRLSNFARWGVRSLIGVALSCKGELAGVLFFEHFGAPRQWTQAEEAYAAALADVVSLALEGAECRRVEQALSQSERRFRDLFLHTSDATGLYRVAQDGAILCEDFNPAAEAVPGLRRDDVAGRQVHEVLDPKCAEKLMERLAQAVTTRSAVVYEQALELPAGTRWFNTAVVPVLDERGQVRQLATIARDVTFQREGEALKRRLELQLADSQKNEALAHFATHIAHDVNNLLTVIIAHAQRLPGSAKDVGQAILEATGRGRELTQQILTFGRQRPPLRKPLELGPLIKSTVRMLEATAPGVSLSVDLPAEPVEVLGDEGQLHQVLLNLCTNAINSLPFVEGRVTVSLRVVPVDEVFAKAHAPLKAGPSVRLSVSDTGSGMDEPTARRIFEPFFSARPEGGGTGLGLAVVQSIVEGHQGAVVVDSVPGHGSTFHVYMPGLSSDARQRVKSQHIMLVDDHPGMARVSAKLLETLGYETSVFDDPREALAAFRERPGTFDVVMTDLSMPHMSGEEFTSSLRELAPTVPVIVSSGMASEADREELHRLGFAGVLLKPWRLEEAVATLKRVLPSQSAVPSPP